MVQDNIKALEDAFLADYGRNRYQTSVGELVLPISYAAEHLQEWMKSKKLKIEA
ncbi:hypothetical protein OBBRIDRAFT_788228 [Obba rivulosa]|uniref:Uncharacterized protein n=1 Tax=Obba rivulosa TaxID=1052685 RepID=A0A8E2DTF3_9APHY|nr:hypothetical protein OBBRIDRAFT_788228 [Obba rivulosa]